MQHGQLDQYYKQTKGYDRQALLLRLNVSASICMYMNKQTIHFLKRVLLPENGTKPLRKKYLLLTMFDVLSILFSG